MTARVCWTISEDEAEPSPGDELATSLNELTAILSLVALDGGYLYPDGQRNGEVGGRDKN